MVCCLNGAKPYQTNKQTNKKKTGKQQCFFVVRYIENVTNVQEYVAQPIKTNNPKPIITPGTSVYRDNPILRGMNRLWHGHARSLKKVTHLI